MSKFLYFAYGSNVLQGRLQKRCPSAKPIGLGIATGHALEFIKPSKDNSGKATLVKCSGVNWYGRLFEIKNDELESLDKAEGNGKGYERSKGFEVLLDTEAGSKVHATIYLATRIDDTLRPYDWYLSLVISGYIEAEIPEEQTRNVALRSYIDDPDPGRKTRKEAEEFIGNAPYAILDDARRKYQSRK